MRPLRAPRRYAGPPPPKRPRDPAPSRLRFRLQRLMLTPLFRATLKFGLPLAAVVAVAGTWIADPANRAAVRGKLTDLREAVEQRPEFMVTDIEIAGADVALAAAISSVIDLDLPQSSFDLDLSTIRSDIVALTAVRDAVVRVRPGGTLEIRAEQREPVAIWRFTDGLRLVDAEGVMTGKITSRADRADLPLIAGEGAREATGEAMLLFAAAEPLRDQIRGLERMGARRWDVVLDDVRILLPPERAVEALERVIALDEAQDLLGRDITVVDLRHGDRPTIRLTPYAAETVRRLAEARLGGDE